MNASHVNVNDDTAVTSGPSPPCEAQVAEVADVAASESVNVNVNASEISSGTASETVNSTVTAAPTDLDALLHHHGTTDEDAATAVVVTGSSLDHALLESLFYNEMALMDDDFLSEALFASATSGTGTVTPNDATATATTTTTASEHATTTTTARVAMEHDLLRDFGVAHEASPMMFGLLSPSLPLPPVVTTDPQHQRNFKDLSAAAAAPTARRGIRHNVVAAATATVSNGGGPVSSSSSSSSRRTATSANSTSTKPPMTTTTTAKTARIAARSAVTLPPAVAATVLAQAPPPWMAAPVTKRTTGSTASVRNGTAATSATTATATTGDAEKRSKLVTQFATLAGRLGITLPPQVLHKLTYQTTATTAAATPGTTAPPTRTLPEMETTALSSNTALFPMGALDTTVLSSSSLTLKRPFDEDGSLGDAVVNGANTIHSATTGDNTNNTSTNKPYSKRRKKPRLSDCERKLAELQAEHTLLQSQCDQIANRHQSLTTERIAAEASMRSMLSDPTATDADLDQAVQNFSDLYSDYGRKRHDELLFHLEQLQRLSNPTNFTKMGLWTLGGGGQDSKLSDTTDSSNPVVVKASSEANETTTASTVAATAAANTAPLKDRSNPIAGMLQKELGISAVQGRKILDQRERIQTVCSNLKECLLLMGKLNALCQQKTQIFHDRMTKCREILTPGQVIKLLIWIDENSQTLGTVCPGWGSEQFQTKAHTPATN